MTERINDSMIQLVAGVGTHGAADLLAQLRQNITFKPLNLKPFTPSFDDEWDDEDDFWGASFGDPVVKSVVNFTKVKAELR